MSRRRRRRRWLARLAAGVLATLAAAFGYAWAEDAGHARGFGDGILAERRRVS